MQKNLSLQPPQTPSNPPPYRLEYCLDTSLTQMTDFKLSDFIMMMSIDSLHCGGWVGGGGDEQV